MTGFASHFSTVLAQEFAQETYNALMGVDVAVVVAEPNSDRVLTSAPYLNFSTIGRFPFSLYQQNGSE